MSSDPFPDVGLLQEAVKPTKPLYWSTPAADVPWKIRGYKMEFCSVVIGLSDRTKGRPIATRYLGDQGENELPVSRPGTIALAEIAIPNEENVIVVSVYSIWEYSYFQKRPMYSDSSAHRIISDISALMCSSKGHNLIVSGDWNIFHGYGDGGSDYWKVRYDTVFERMESLGLKFAGPQYPGGTRADRNPTYFPLDCKNVPTFKQGGVRKPASAHDQLDFVFASATLFNRLRVKALNAPDEWGPSDHCRIAIDLM